MNLLNAFSQLFGWFDLPSYAVIRLSIPKIRFMNHWGTIDLGESCTGS